MTSRLMGYGIDQQLCACKRWIEAGQHLKAEGQRVGNDPDGLAYAQPHTLDTCGMTLCFSSFNNLNDTLSYREFMHIQPHSSNAPFWAKSYRTHVFTTWIAFSDSAGYLAVIDTLRIQA